MGGSCGDRKTPLNSFTPFKRFGVSSALTVRVTCGAIALFGCHVDCHRPSKSGRKESGGSPLENETTTVPEVSGPPQSSLTCTSKPTGQPALTENDGESVTMLGMRLDGAHDASAAGLAPEMVVMPVFAGMAETDTERVIGGGGS